VFKTELQKNGLRPAADPQFVAIARIVRPQGRRGEVAAEVLTDFPVRFASLRTAFLEQPGGGPGAVEIENAWMHKGSVILKFSGVDSIDEASSLRGRHVLIKCSERMAPAAHQYYTWELEGSRVVRDVDGVTMEIGIVTEVEPTGGVPLLHVVPTKEPSGNSAEASGSEARKQAPRNELLIPFAQAICKRINVDAKLIVIDPPEDLLELNR
jgi:16S rRNA processing protein RimM